MSTEISLTPPTHHLTDSASNMLKETASDTIPYSIPLDKTFNLQLMNIPDANHDVANDTLLIMNDMNPKGLKSWLDEELDEDEDMSLEAYDSEYTNIGNNGSNGNHILTNENNYSKFVDTPAIQTSHLSPVATTNSIQDTKRKAYINALRNLALSMRKSEQSRLELRRQFNSMRYGSQATAEFKVPYTCGGLQRHLMSYIPQATPATRHPYIDAMQQRSSTLHVAQKMPYLRIMRQRPTMNEGDNTNIFHGVPITKSM